jgi:cob(I)alamin adenosyltransferase
MDVVSAVVPPLVAAAAFLLVVRAVIRHANREERAERDNPDDGTDVSS